MNWISAESQEKKGARSLEAKSHQKLIIRIHATVPPTVVHLHTNKKGA